VLVPVHQFLLLFAGNQNKTENPHLVGMLESKVKGAEPESDQRQAKAGGDRAHVCAHSAMSMCGVHACARDGRVWHSLSLHVCVCLCCMVCGVCMGVWCAQVTVSTNHVPHETGRNLSSTVQCV
jgi:hypothetical protein